MHVKAEDAKVSILDTVTAILLDREGVRWLEGLEHHIASCIELLDQVKREVYSLIILLN